jgi:hypothetical protein
MNALLYDVIGGLVTHGDWVWGIFSFLVFAVAESLANRQPARAAGRLRD